jgi:hypothetical protein
MPERDKYLVALAERYPYIFCRGCLRLGSYCICEEPLDNDGPSEKAQAANHARAAINKAMENVRKVQQPSGHEP